MYAQQSTEIVANNGIMQWWECVWLQGSEKRPGYGEIQTVPKKIWIVLDKPRQTRMIMRTTNHLE